MVCGELDKKFEDGDGCSRSWSQGFAAEVGEFNGSGWYEIVTTPEWNSEASSLRISKISRLAAICSFENVKILSALSFCLSDFLMSCFILSKK